MKTKKPAKKKPRTFVLEGFGSYLSGVDTPLVVYRHKQQAARAVKLMGGYFVRVRAVCEVVK